MKHNEVSDLVRTMITRSWDDEIYKFADRWSGWDAKPGRVEADARKHFAKLGALKVEGRFTGSLQRKLFMIGDP